MLSFKLLLVFGIIATGKCQSGQLWQCTTRLSGPVHDHWVPIKLRTDTIERGVRVKRFNYQPPSICVRGELEVTACDYDLAPQVQFTSSLSILVVRTGFLRSPAEVTTKIWCLVYENSVPSYGSNNQGHSCTGSNQDPENQDYQTNIDPLSLNYQDDDYELEYLKRRV